MDILKMIQTAMISQGIDKEIIDKILFEQAVAVLVKNDLPPADMMSKNRDENSSMNTSAIAITTRGMNIFLDENIVYEQDEESCKHLFKERIILIGKNLMAIKRLYSGDVNIPTKGIITCHAHVGFHWKSSGKNQMYIGRIKKDSEIFNTFRSLLVVHDTLVIIKLIDNSFCVMGFPQNTLIADGKAIYKGIKKEKEREDAFTNINKLDYDDRDFSEESDGDVYADVIKQIDLDAYEHERVTIDTTKECLKDLGESNNLRIIRKGRHNHLVAYFGRYLETKGYKAEMNKSIDLLFKKDEDTVVVCEMKTLNSEKTDLRSQALKAFAQLFYYRMYKLGEYSESKKIILAVVFDNKISDEFVRFFEENDIVVFWRGKNGIDGTDKARTILQ